MSKCSKEKFKLFVKSIFALSILTGCGNWSGNPKKVDKTIPGDQVSLVSLEFRGENSASALLVSDSIPVFDKNGNSTGSMQLSSARVSLRKIKLIAESSSETHDAEFDGPYIVDLLANTTKPDLAKLEMPSGSYDTIKLQLAKLEEDEAEGLVNENDALIRNSIHLTGTYSGINETKSFSMLFDLDEEFFIPISQDQQSLDLEAGIEASILISFYLSKWFDFTDSDFDLSDITESEIVLDKESEGSEKSIRESIKDLVKDSAEFSKNADDEGDGEDED